MMTVAKWAELGARDLKHAVKDRIRGGTKNPHLSTFSLITSVASRRLSVEQARAKIKAVDGADRRAILTRRLESFLKLFPLEEWKPLKLPRSQPFRGPRGIIEIGTSPHLSVGDAKYRHLIAMRNNKTPVLGTKGALIANLLMLYGAGLAEGKIDVAQTIDLTTGTHFSLTDLDEFCLKPLNDFAERLEDEILKAA